MIIWICGPSGAGKTTIGGTLYQHLKADMPNLFLLDGDEFRAAMGNDLGYSVEDRRKNGLRIARLCQLLESQGISVICCGATIQPEVQEFNRTAFRQYCEVVVEVSFETLLTRDTKKIYTRALEGKLAHVVGVDIGLARPFAPHIVLDNNEDRTSFDDLVRPILTLVNGAIKQDAVPTQKGPSIIRSRDAG